MRFVDKFNTLLIFFLFLLYGILFLQKINLVTADLGRHIKNGEMVLRGGTLRDVLRTNFYSYTCPGFPFLNHHWGSGVIFYLVHQLTGFVGLSVLSLVVSLMTFGIFFDIARKEGGFGPSFITAVLLFPVITSRTEIRPEEFSYLFCGIFLWVLWKTRDSEERANAKKLLFILPFLEAFWINLHIYFFFGFLLIGVFLTEAVVRGRLNHVKKLGSILLLSVSASFINPAGIRGILYPLRIFGNYGYRVLENQGVLFLDKIIKYPPNLYFKIGFGLLLASWVFVLWKRKGFSLSSLFLTVFISCLGWTAVRNFTLFGLFALPIAASNFNENLARKEVEDNVLRNFIVSSLSVLIIFVLILVNISHWRTKMSFGFGLKEGAVNAARFFKEEKLNGPIFNNYDNGGYLIYCLYPEEKVFIDNRPEAYPKEFINEVYIPMQENGDKWGQMDQQYNFNAIFFHRHDLTPWAQAFLILRIKDENWAPVFVDDYSIIFLKRNEKNKELIKKFELSKKMFSMVKN